MIEIAGSSSLDAPPERAWPLLFDPAALMQFIPGCQSLEQAGLQEYRGQIQVGVAGLSGSYQAHLRVLAQDPPVSCAFEGEVEGPAGVLSGQAQFRLAPGGPGSLIEYEATAVASGALARLSPRLVAGVAQALIQVGLKNLNAQLQSLQAAQADKAQGA